MNAASASPGDCPFQEDSAIRALAEAVAEHDLDRAIEIGLLTFDPAPHHCDRCRDTVARIAAARDDRLRALAARERYRARQARLAERADARARKRAGAAVRTSAVAATSTLPPAVAAALARAKAKVAAKRPPE